MTSVVGASIPSHGWKPETTRVRVWNRTGGSVRRGDLVYFDLGQTQAEVTTHLPGSAASVFANVTKVPATTSLGTFQRFGLSAVALEDMADDRNGYVALRGLVDAYVFTSTTGAVTKGVGLRMSGTQKVLTGNVAAGMCVGIQLVATSASAVDEATAELVPIYFNGVEGVGPQN